MSETFTNSAASVSTTLSPSNTMGSGNTSALSSRLGPAHSRLWIFPLERKLDEGEGRKLIETLLPFVESWKAHKVPVEGRAFLFEGKFLFVSADEGVTKVSGCSTDALFRAVKGAADSLGIVLSDPATVHYRSSVKTSGSSPGEPAEIVSLSRAAFKELAKAGEINQETLVFDPTLTVVGEVLEEKFERPLRDSWHARLLG